MSNNESNQFNGPKRIRQPRTKYDALLETGSIGYTPTGSSSFDFTQLEFEIDHVHHAMVSRYEEEYRKPYPGPLAVAKSIGMLTRDEFNEALDPKHFATMQEMFVVIILMELGEEI